MPASAADNPRAESTVRRCGHRFSGQWARERRGGAWWWRNGGRTEGMESTAVRRCAYCEKELTVNEGIHFGAAFTIRRPDADAGPPFCKWEHLEQWRIDPSRLRRGQMLEHLDRAHRAHDRAGTVTERSIITSERIYLLESALAHKFPPD